MDDRPRKDRLIQTRVPQDLESTLKDEARKRRLSVSHLIRNVLEDTFSLVDNVVTEVDRVVHDSVGVAQALKRDARRLAATARGETAHRERAQGRGEQREGDPVEDEESRDEVPAIVVESRVVPEPASEPEPERVAETVGETARLTVGEGALSGVYGFQELVLNRPVHCASCNALIQRGSRAFLGMSDKPAATRVWVCQECLDTIAG